jgi:homoserine O-acetyltransferase/O-succinyltransferase
MGRILALYATLALAFAAPSRTADAHWPGQPQHQMAYLGDLELEDGGVIKNLRMSYVTHGTLNAAKDNAILFLHGFGANHHQLDHLIGPGRALDTKKYFIICTDELGNSQTTFEHSTSPTNSGLKMRFPQYKGRDRVKAEHKLVTQALGISHLFAVTGISSGAGTSVQFAVSYPNFMDGIVLISGGALWSTHYFFRGNWMISIIESCDGWKGGDYEENPKGCATNALSVLVPYFYSREWWDQYIDTPEAYTKWRNTWGEYYLDVQDARDLHYRAVAAFRRGGVGDTPGLTRLDAALGSIKATALFVMSPHDQFIAPQHVERQVKAIPRARVVWIDSVAGHLICCNADPNATRILGDAMSGFLQELAAQRKATR